MVVLKGKKVGRPNGARERYIVEHDREGTTDVQECLPPARISRDLPNYESRALQEQTRDKARRRSTLLVRTTFPWEYAYGRLRNMVSSEDSSNTSSTASCVREVCVLFACALCLIWICLHFSGKPRTVRSTSGLGSKASCT